MIAHFWLNALGRLLIQSLEAPRSDSQMVQREVIGRYRSSVTRLPRHNSVGRSPEREGLAHRMTSGHLLIFTYRNRSLTNQFCRMSWRLFVTGRTGFVGTHLEREIASKPTDAAEKIVGPTEFVDLLDRTALREAVSACRPNAAIHLAGKAFVPDSFNNPRATL